MSGCALDSLLIPLYKCHRPSPDRSRSGQVVGVPFDVSADGKRFLIVSTPKEGSAITVVVNWPELLKNK